MDPAQPASSESATCERGAREAGAKARAKGSQKLIQPCAFPPVNPLFATVGAAELTTAAFDEQAPESGDDEFEEEDVPEGEAGGSSGKRPRVE